MLQIVHPLNALDIAINCLIGPNSLEIHVFSFDITPMCELSNDVLQILSDETTYIWSSPAIQEEKVNKMRICMLQLFIVKRNTDYQF